MKTTSAPKSAEKYEMMAPAQGPKVYPDKMISVEYNGIGAARMHDARQNYFGLYIGMYELTNGRQKDKEKHDSVPIRFVCAQPE
jgi:hypothetical protein